MTRLWLPFFLLLIILAAPAAGDVQASPGVDTNLFGYTVDIYPGAQWVELDGDDNAHSIVFKGVDDGLSCNDENNNGTCDLQEEIGPIPLGMDFPFFENTYADVFVSTNGLLLFGPQTGNSYVTNRTIPTGYLPQNMIAGFWDDLILVNDQQSRVYYLDYDNCPVGSGRCTIIEYYRVLKLGEASPSPFSFEIILHESGMIIFQYDSLPINAQECTVGIEDDQGVDGELVYYNEPGLVPLQKITFSYPDPGKRMKMFPLYEGGFLRNNASDLAFTLRNTGTAPSQFTLSLDVLEGKTPGDGWSFIFYDSSGTEIPTEGILLGVGEQERMILRVTAPDGAARGDFSRVAITANAQDATPVTIIRQTAVAAPFTAALLGENNIQMQITTPARQFLRQVQSGYSGTALSLAYMGDTYYLPHWEISGYTPGGDNYKNSALKRVNVVGGSSLIQTLADHSQEEDSINDNEVMLAMAPDGTVGAVFFRSTHGDSMMEEVYWQEISAYGKPQGDPVLLDSNSGDLNRSFSQPVMTATTSDQFVVVWNVHDNNGEEILGDLHYAILKTDGEITRPAESLVGAIFGGSLFNSAMVAPLLDGRVLAVFQETTPEGLVSIQYTLIDSAGTVEEPVEISSAPSLGRVDVTILADGSPLVAWIEEDGINLPQVKFVVLTVEAGGFVSTVQALSLPDDRPAADLSVTTDTQGYGVIAWGERFYSRVYYALVDAAGSVITPAMSFRTADAGSLLRMGTEGVSIAPCPDELIWKQAMPTILR